MVRDGKLCHVGQKHCLNSMYGERGCVCAGDKEMNVAGFVYQEDHPFSEKCISPLLEGTLLSPVQPRGCQSHRSQSCPRIHYSGGQETELNACSAVPLVITHPAT